VPPKSSAGIRRRLTRACKWNRIKTSRTAKKIKSPPVGGQCCAGKILKPGHCGIFRSLPAATAQKLKKDAKERKSKGEQPHFDKGE